MLSKSYFFCQYCSLKDIKAIKEFLEAEAVIKEVVITAPHVNAGKQGG